MLRGMRSKKYKKLYKRRYGKKGFKKYKKYYTGNLLMKKPLVEGFPQAYKCKLKYNEIFTFTSGTAADYQFGLNCVYDPYLGAGG